MTRPSFKNAEGHELFDGTSMTEAARSPQPRTAAGRAILRRLHPLTGGTLISIPHAKRIGLVELLRPLVLAIEAEAAQHSLERSVRRGGLDVSVLAQVLQNSTAEAFGPIISPEFWHKQAEALAAEYARLAAPQPSARLTPQRKPPADLPRTAAATPASEAYVLGHIDRYRRDREPDILCRHCGKPWAKVEVPTDPEPER